MGKQAIAVLISDIHYNLNTLEVADKAMRMAISRANTLGVPLIVAGDLHDTKANMRAECVNAMLETFSLVREDFTTYILRGNHDQINEKSFEHSLNFLAPYAKIIDTPCALFMSTGVVSCIPYQNSPEKWLKALNKIPKNDIIIAHQGLAKSLSGEYIQDHSAVSREAVAGRRVVSGHYHNRQTIALPDGGKWDYIGNPYTLGFGEANDPEKGFQVLYDDGSLEFVPTNLRRHQILETSYAELQGSFDPRKIQWSDTETVLWVKVSGPQDKLSQITKPWLAAKLDYTQDFRLDLIPNDISNNDIAFNSTSTPQEILDAHIEAQDLDKDTQYRIKKLWRRFV